MTAHEAMTRLFSARPAEPPAASIPNRAVFPRNRAAIVAAGRSGGRELRYPQWGFLLPQVSKRTGRPIKPKAVTNARSETIRTSPFWRDSFRFRRCLVPATAYCEPKGRKPAVYHWFGVADPAGGQSQFAFAGLWQTFHGEQYGGADPCETFTIATTEPNEFAVRFHSRMPVILDSSEYEQWLFGTDSEAADLLNPFESGSMFLIAKGEGLKVCPDADGRFV